MIGRKKVQNRLFGEFEGKPTRDKRMKIKTTVSSRKTF